MATRLSSKSTLLFHNAVNLINAANSQVYKQTNSIIVFTYYYLGKMIIDSEQQGNQKALYGEETIKQLSKKLTQKFGNGYSKRNLELMRLFYLTYRVKKQEKGIAQTVSAQFENKGVVIANTFRIFVNRMPLSWSIYALLLRIKNDDERSFYEVESKQSNWSARELQRQIDSGLFERFVLSKDKKQIKAIAKKGQIIQKPEDLVKSHYILDFLGIKEKSAYNETDLESAIIGRIEQFLLEMGKGFLFQGRQVRISIESDNFYVDLVLYNRILKCFVLIELKIGKLRHQDIGQLQMYVNYFDRYVKHKGERATIGIIICKNKNNSMVEITLPKTNKTIFAKEYKLYLPSKASLIKLVGAE